MWAGLLDAMHLNNLPLQPIEKRDLHPNSSVRIHAGYFGTEVKLLIGYNLSQHVNWILLSMQLDGRRIRDADEDEQCDWRLAAYSRVLARGQG